MHFNPILLTDSYKASHWLQYPPNTKKVYSYFESRGGEFSRIMFFGLQYFLKEYLSTPVTMEDVDAAELRFRAHMGIFNRDGWKNLVRKCGGRWPVEIKAVPEGSIIPPSNVLMTVENTDPEFYWVTNYLETLLVETWYPCTVATNSFKMKETFLKYLRETGDPSLIDFKIHDFGFRGVSCPEQAGLGGCAHLTNFKGTDTVVALEVARQIYHEEMAGFSIPAAEHSTITSWGREAEENGDPYLNMLQKYPTGLMACVSDSFDIYRVCRDLWGGKLKEKVLLRDGVLVVRPDSGNPPEIVVECLKILGERIGETTNEKGYKVLHPKVRMIQGDGIDVAMVDEILRTMKAKGWSADNLAMGSGGGLLQKLNRDTCKFAFKASYCEFGEKKVNVYKQPVTAEWKNSKKGKLKLIQDGTGSYATVSQDYSGIDLLETVYKNGFLLKDQTLSEIRKRSSSYL